MTREIGSDIHRVRGEVLMLDGASARPSGRNLTVESDVTFRLACANASLRHARGHRN